MNVPNACAGMAVNPGDLMLCDADGVIAVPVDQLDALLPLVLAHADKEDGIRTTNRAGTADPERFNALLRKKGCPV
jgi:regulator of RNase E activity RraA